MSAVWSLGRSSSAARTEACDMSNLSFPVKRRTSNRRLSTLLPLPRGVWPPPRPGLGWCWRATAAAWQLLGLFAGTLTSRRHLGRSYSTTRHTRGRPGTPTCDAQAAAHEIGQIKGPILLHKAAVDARGPDVTGKDGCLARGECQALSSLMHRLISRFNFYCGDSRCWIKYTYSPFAAIHKRHPAVLYKRSLYSYYTIQSYSVSFALMWKIFHQSNC